MSGKTELLLKSKLKVWRKGMDYTTAKDSRKKKK